LTTPDSPSWTRSTRGSTPRSLLGRRAPSLHRRYAREPLVVLDRSAWTSAMTSASSLSRTPGTGATGPGLPSTRIPRTHGELVATFQGGRHNRRCKQRDPPRPRRPMDPVRHLRGLLPVGGRGRRHASPSSGRPSPSTWWRAWQRSLGHHGDLGRCGSASTALRRCSARSPSAGPASGLSSSWSADRRRASRGVSTSQGET
jgi:hypothetical protein